MSDDRPCTCHPNDNPPRPCPKKYAYTDCLKAEIERLRQQITEGLVSKCFICDEVDSPRDGCDCVCCSIKRARTITPAMVERAAEAIRQKWLMGNIEWDAIAEAALRAALEDK